MDFSINLRDLTVLMFKNLPPNVSVEELMYTVVLADKTLEGQKDAIEGKTISTNDLLQEMQNWKRSSPK